MMRMGIRWGPSYVVGRMDSTCVKWWVGGLGISMYVPFHPATQSGKVPHRSKGHFGDDHKGPVPRYKEKLQKSMDRYFTGIPVGKYVKRANVSRRSSGIAASVREKLNLIFAYLVEHFDKPNPS